MNTQRILMRLPLCLTCLCVAAALGGQESRRPIKIAIKDGPTVTDALALPLDPNPRIKVDYQAFPYFCLMLEGKNLTFNPQGIIASVRVDNQFQPFGFINFNGRLPQPKPLGPGPFNKKRLGTEFTWSEFGVKITRIVEIVPSRVTGAIAPGQKRHLDTVRISYTVENTDSRNHDVDMRVWIDTMIAANDGALFAAPSTHPGQILDGVVLKDKTLPEYLQVLENPNLKNPGMIGTLTLKFGGKADTPNKVVLTNNLGPNQGGWDIMPVKANGDSGCALFWPIKTLKPGDKREMVFAFGRGVALGPESEGRVALALGGSFEPGKVFTITATVEDPAVGQTLTLELPVGMERIEGKERQPVPPPEETGTSLVLWKGRVQQPGDYEIKIRSSTGVTHTKIVSVQSN